MLRLTFYSFVMTNFSDIDAAAAATRMTATATRPAR